MLVPALASRAFSVGLNVTFNDWTILLVTSSWTANRSDRSRSKRSAHKCPPVVASMSCAVILTRLPARRTEPSSTERTPRSRPTFCLTAATRSGAGWPLVATRHSHRTRRAAIASVITVMARPTTIRRITPDLPVGAGCQRHRATGLEWQTESPPPKHNFHEILVVTHPPYQYSPEKEEEMVHG